MASLNRKWRVKLYSTMHTTLPAVVEAWNRAFPAEDFFEGIDLNEEEARLTGYHCGCCGWEAYRPDFREEDPYDYLVWVETVRPCVKFPNNPLMQLHDELSLEA